MSLLRRLSCPAAFNYSLSCHRLLSFSAAAVRQDVASLYTPAPISLIEPAVTSSPLLFHVHLDLSESPELLTSYTIPGQYLQLRVPGSPRRSLLAIASPPSRAIATGEFEFLVKSVEGSTAEAVCRMRKGDVVEVSQAMGKGFDIDRITPPEKFPSVFIFATGSGIRRSDVRLYYGARNLERMAYRDRFKDWESSGVKIIPVLSKPDIGWSGEIGYVQAAFNRTIKNFSPLATGVVFCGQRQMAEGDCNDPSCSQENRRCNGCLGDSNQQ